MRTSFFLPRPITSYTITCATCNTKQPLSASNYQEASAAAKERGWVQAEPRVWVCGGCALNLIP